jgi:hypothetical protein
VKAGKPSLKTGARSEKSLFVIHRYFRGGVRFSARCARRDTFFVIHPPNYFFVIHFRGTFKGEGIQSGGAPLAYFRTPILAPTKAKGELPPKGEHPSPGGVRKRGKGGVGDPWLKRPMGDRDRSTSMIGRPDVYFRYFFPGPCPPPFVLGHKPKDTGEVTTGGPPAGRCSGPFPGEPVFRFSGKPVFRRACGRLLPTFHAAEAGERNRVLRNYHSNKYHSN